MSRTLEQILAEEQIVISPDKIQTKDALIAIGDSWIVSEYHWAHTWSHWYNGTPSAVAVAVLVAAVWMLVQPIPADMPWLMPVLFGAAIGAVWSIGNSLWGRFVMPRTPTYPSRGITFSISGSEGSVTIFQSDDEHEIKLVRQKLEQTLSPNTSTGD